MSRPITLGVLALMGAGTLSAQSRGLSGENAASISSITWGDYDGDGLEDALVVSSCASARLLRNVGNGTLQDVTEESGLPTALVARFALWEDVDRDRDRDLLVLEIDGTSHLFRNQGSSTFVEITESAGIRHAGEALHAGFFDFDDDGLPDLQVSTSSSELLYHNLGSGLFEPVDLGPAAAPLVESSIPSASAIGQSRASSERAGEAGIPLDLSLAGRAKLLVPPPSVLDAIPFPACALAIKDQDGTGCLRANSIPTLGMLYPLSEDLFVSGGGNVGIGTLFPLAKLDVSGLVAVRNGNLSLFNFTGFPTITLDNSSGGDGSISIRNEAGNNRIVLDGGSSDLGGDITVSAADGSNSLFLDGESTNGGGEVSLRNDVAEETIELLGEDQDGDNSGRITLFDMFGANSHAAIVLEARENTGGGEIQISSGNPGFAGILLDGDLNNVAQLTLLENDGSPALSFEINTLCLKNAAGATTILFNRMLGTKSAVVDTQSYGRRLLYTIESPEVWFEDFGSARLEKGVALVELDPIFLETVTIDEANPMKVFVTMNGKSPGFWVEKGADDFVVVELSGGTGNVAFDWRVVAKRKGLESLRLRSFDEELVEEAALGVDQPAATGADGS